MTRCGAHRRDGEQCQAEAVEGWTVCERHGAGSPEEGRAGGRPRVHGAYSRAIRAEEAGTLEELRALGLGLEDEMAVARLQLARALRWATEEQRQRCDGKRCPLEVVDARLALVSRIAVRGARVMEWLSPRFDEEAEVERIVEVIERHVPDAETRAAIGAELRSGRGRGGGVLVRRKEDEAEASEGGGARGRRERG